MRRCRLAPCSTSLLRARSSRRWWMRCHTSAAIRSRWKPHRRDSRVRITDQPLVRLRSLTIFPTRACKRRKSCWSTWLLHMIRFPSSFSSLLPPSVIVDKYQEQPHLLDPYLGKQGPATSPTPTPLPSSQLCAHRDPDQQTVCTGSEARCPAHPHAPGLPLPIPGVQGTWAEGGCPLVLP